MSATEAERQELQRELLVEEVKQLTNTLAHLEQSVKELQEEHQRHPDPVYKEAIDENLVTLAKYRAKLAAVQGKLQGAAMEGVEVAPHVQT